MGLLMLVVDHRWGGAAGASRRRNLDYFYAIPTRDPSARQLTTGHCPAVPTRASQSDQLSLPSRRPPGSSDVKAGRKVGQFCRLKSGPPWSRRPAA